VKLTIARKAHPCSAQRNHERHVKFCDGTPETIAAETAQAARNEYGIGAHLPPCPAGGTIQPGERYLEDYDNGTDVFHPARWHEQCAGLAGL
jgi:hypothetical protein